MKQTINIKNLTINLKAHNLSTEDNKLDQANDSEKMQLLVETLRNIALDQAFKDKEIRIPEGCEENGFVMGDYAISNFLYFIADMLEE